MSVEQSSPMHYEAECPECGIEFGVEGVRPERCVLCGAELEDGE